MTLNILTTSMSQSFEPDSIEREIIVDDHHHHDNSRVHSIPNEGIHGDIFCAGHVFLPDGSLLVAGGIYKYNRLCSWDSFSAI